MKWIRRFLQLILCLAMLFMGLLILCAWKPEVTDMIASWLYPDRLEGDLADAGGGPPGAAEENAQTAEAENSDVSDDNVPRRTSSVAGEGVDGDSPQTVVSTQEAGEEAVVYIPPAESEITVPEEVAGRNGYQEIEGSDSEVEDTEAEELSESLDVGETGDGITFDPLFYPYYAMLDEKGQHIYRQIYANANVLNPSFAPVEPVTAQQLRDIISAVYYDHPELFWVDTAYACKRRANGQCVEIDLQFNRTAKNLAAENSAFEASAAEILSGAESFASDYDKERYVHDALMKSIEYVTSSEINQSAYSALVNGRTVCAGYARAFQYLMQQLGIPCYYCVGYAGENHAWNIIKLDDGYYNVDVTWDDTGDGTYDYFNKTDGDYADTHVRQEKSVNLPPCNGKKYRTAGVSTGEEGLRSSADAGFPDEAILHSMSQYYDECYGEILRRGYGNYEFSKVLEGEELYAEWEEAYDSEQYKQEYMIEAMRSIGAKSCKLDLKIEKLQQDRYLITHSLQLH